TGAAAVGKVRAMRSAVSTEHLSIRTDDGRRVEVTRHHPFWDPHARKFRSIGTFPPGDSLLVWQDGECRVVRVASVEIIHRPETVYHPEVDRPPHTFVADGFIVHNKPPEIPLVDVTLRVVPGDAGWINLGNRFVGQGSDTSFTLTNGSYFLEAVAREGWMFDHWEGDVSPVDTFVVNFQPRDGDRVACHFAPRP
ncbi:MAG: Hint domain-containing protein, partial [Candidatus Krumholzibacteria bacterium]|nr:Hint domain-containing protein [Candidatus Krumholzibacteria bacterium]